MPEDISNSFSESQLSSLKAALASRQWGHHNIDIRGTVPWFKYRYYYVFLAGKNRRQLSDREQRVSNMLKAALMSAFMLFSCLFGLLCLYLIKSALGINLFEHFSLGIWDWFKVTFS
nr:3-phosphoshikimate 1-carboxyvinyltransferase [Neptunicella marina]